MKFFNVFVLVMFCSFGFGQVSDLELVFSKYEAKSINTHDLMQQVRSRTNGKIYLSIDKWDLELEHSNLLSPDYKFIDQDGNEILDKHTRPIPLNGYTAEGGRVSLTIAQGFVYGFINDGNELFYIEPLRHYSDTKNKDEVVIYNTKEVKSSAPMKCGVEAANEKKILLNKPEATSRMAGLCYDVEYAIVNDWSMYSKYGASGLEARNIAITNDVNTNYKDDFSDEIRLVITGQFNSTCSSCNPFGVTTNLNTTLDNFRAWGNTNLGNPNSNDYIPNDVASFWSDVFNNSGTVGLAWVGAICSSYRYNVLSDLSTNANTLRVLTAHELGHNFAAGHDASGSGFLMAPSVNNTSTWSSASISSINGHINSVKSCFDGCTDSPAVVFFNSAPISVIESAGSGTGGSCQEKYSEYTVQVSISKAPSANVSVSLNTSGSSASSVYDYQLVTNSITFSPTGSLDQTVTYRIYDDAIVENEETMKLDFSIVSGPGQASANNSLDIDIISNDIIETLSSGPGDTVVYGNEPLSLANAGFLEGSRTDVRSRFLILASELSALGLTAGEIDMMAFYVYEKNSTGTFNNFRIGLKEISQSTLDGVSWQTTTNVYTGNIQTVESAWNSFNFSSPFEWDGTSNLYVDMCFDNSTTIGQDKIVLFDTGDANAQMCSWSTNTLNNCGSVTNWTYYYDRAPYLLLRQKGSSEAETASVTSSDGRIRTGETANLFSENGKLIATIKNIGASLQCIDATVRTSGSARATLPFDSGQYTDKTIEVNVDGSSDYELTLYYTDEELAIWGGENHSLNFVKTSTNLATATSGSFISSTNVNTAIGAENVVAYTTTVSGSGYFALSNGAVVVSTTANVSGTFENADVVLEDFSKGLLLKNNLGNQYLLTVNTAGTPVATLNNSLTGSASLPQGDLCIITAGKSLMIKRSASSYTKISIDNDGAITTVNTSTVPSQRISLATGHFGLVDLGSGVIFQNAQNECYKLFIDDNGVIRTGVVPCP